MWWRTWWKCKSLLQWRLVPGTSVESYRSSAGPSQWHLGCCCLGVHQNPVSAPLPFPSAASSGFCFPQAELSLLQVYLSLKLVSRPAFLITPAGGNFCGIVTMPILWSHYLRALTAPSPNFTPSQAPKSWKTEV